MPDESTTQETQDQTTSTTNEGAQPVSYDEWIEAQDESIKTMLDDRVKGLKSALDAERGERKRYEKELRDAAKKLEAGSDARAALEEQADKLKEVERKNAFYDLAHAAGCTNLRLGYLAALEEDLIRADGTADMESMKARFPELFGVKQSIPPGHAGSGHNQPPAPTGINAWIRQQAGRGR